MGFERFGSEFSDLELLEAGIERERIGRPMEAEAPEDGEVELVFESLEPARPAWTGSPWRDDFSCGCTELLWTPDGELYALEAGFLQLDCGIAPEDFFALCAARGLEAELVREGSFTDLMELLREHDGVVCAVNSAALQSPRLADWPGLVADRAVAVARVELDDPAAPRVKVADAATGPEGLTVDLDVFLRAWNAGGGAAIGLSKRTMPSG